ncbi:hypothetical protein PR048_030514 [Dryococelus australis]|uniref:Uncharacterized protein n=1 Tax=Dryococelus australis TaxID=614101 RepID=A0ABQ9G972_9NEOP|nr:hypothetical protein PR048_030514 [Dryococelus australis]
MECAARQLLRPAFPCNNLANKARVAFQRLRAVAPAARGLNFDIVAAQSHVKRILLRAQTIAQSVVAKAYKTVSNNALLVLVCAVPFDLIIHERNDCRGRKPTNYKRKAV